MKRRDVEGARKVIAGDNEINQKRFDIENDAMTLIATQQPAASDLRAVVAAMNIVVEMERMADHASGIAKTVILMGDEPLLKPLIDIPRMADLSRQMLSDCLQAYIDRMAGTAKDIANRINEISFNSSLLRELRSIDFVSRLIETGQVKRGEMKDVLIHSVMDDDLMRSLSVATTVSRANESKSWIRRWLLNGHHTPGRSALRSRG